MDVANIGDYYSSPGQYFSYPGHSLTHGEILDVAAADLQGAHIIVGGGGLLDEWFQPSFEALFRHDHGRLIAWGMGQQLDTGPWYKRHHQFDYPSFLSPFNIVGIRDYKYGYPWVPCASCMHPLFDKAREVKHEFVVYSHKSRPIPICDFPKMTNEINDLDEVLDFLGSAETILTSSYHGAYWGLLLNRKVLAFPFNSKFFTFKHQPSLYPALWKAKRALISRGKRPVYELEMVKGWRLQAGAARNYRNALAECREANRRFYADTVKLLA